MTQQNLTVAMLRRLLDSDLVTDNTEICVVQPGLKRTHITPLQPVVCEIGDVGAVLQVYQDPETGARTALLQFALADVSYEDDCIVPFVGHVLSVESPLEDPYRNCGTKYPEGRDPVNPAEIQRLLGEHVGAVHDGPFECVGVGDAEETYRQLEAEMRKQGLILPGEAVDMELDQTCDKEGNPAHGLYVYKIAHGSYVYATDNRPREFMMCIVYGDEA
jgi:hypothetical protein